MSIKKSILARVVLSFWVALAIGGVLILQIINIQWLQGATWQQKAQDMSLQYRVRKAPRGSIYAANGTFLATSIPLYKLALDPTLASEELYRDGIDSLSNMLARFFQDRTPLDYKRRINEARRTKKRYVSLGTRLVNFDEKLQLEKYPILREGQYKGGILWEKIEERVYPFGGLASRTIGYLNENNEGAGLELSFNHVLAGIPGKALYQRIAGGEWMPIGSGSRINPVEGHDLYTSLDINLQDLAHHALLKALIKNEAQYGCAIVMEVKTGEVRAMVNLGKVQNPQDTNALYAENYNYAVGDRGSTDPGSTFKIASLLALMEDSTYTLEDTIQTGGGTYQYYDRVMRDTKPGGWGMLTLQQVIENSSNIGVSRLITRHFGNKPALYVDYLRKFGLTNSLEASMKLKGMTTPYIKDPKKPQDQWSGVTLPWMSVGYEMRISPLQMLTFCNAIANGGYMVQPSLVRKVKKGDIDLEVFVPQVAKQRIAAPANLEKIKTAMIGVVERGTAKNIRTDKYKIAGKTGTSQKLDGRGRYRKKYHTSFMGFFPAEQPKYSCIVVIDEPKGEAQYGADVAAPVFKEIADRLYAQDVDVQTQAQAAIRRDVPLFQTNLPTNQVGYAEDMHEICQALQIPSVDAPTQSLVSAKVGKLSVTWEHRPLKPNVVPNLRGLSLRDALPLLENMGLQVTFNGRGRVKTQSIMPGTAIRRGEKITIQLE